MQPSFPVPPDGSQAVDLHEICLPPMPCRAGSPARAIAAVRSWAALLLASITCRLDAAGSGAPPAPPTRVAVTRPCLQHLRLHPPHLAVLVCGIITARNPGGATPSTFVTWWRLRRRDALSCKSWAAHWRSSRLPPLTTQSRRPPSAGAVSAQPRPPDGSNAQGYRSTGVADRIHAGNRLRALRVDSWRRLRRPTDLARSITHVVWKLIFTAAPLDGTFGVLTGMSRSPSPAVNHEPSASRSLASLLARQRLASHAQAPLSLRLRPFRASGSALRYSPAGRKPPATW